jgi:ADP-heptose:LPS heptosyltransferase
MQAVGRILLIGHTNIGDAIMASPVIEQLHRRFPRARLTLVIGRRARPLFAKDPRVHQLIEIESFGEGIGRLRMPLWLWSLNPDLLIDVRQTILPLLWRPWRIFRYFWPIPRRVVHMKDRHLWRMHRQLLPLTRRVPPIDARLSIHIPPDAAAGVQRQLSRWRVDASRPLVLLCPGARGHTRRWYPDRFAALADRLIEEVGAEVLLTGEPDESSLVEEILRGMRHRAHSAIGLTTLTQLAALMQQVRLVIVQDSGPLHLASAVDAPVLALFGPSNPRKFGPSSSRQRVIQRPLFCVPCEVAQCRFNHECMRFIHVDEVFEAAKQLLRQETGDKRQVRANTS